VFARRNNRGEIFITDRDRETYLKLLGKVTVEREWHTMAYCLMSNHLHLLVETCGPVLGIGMQRLHGAYARTFNGSRGRKGHLFEERFGWTPIQSDAQFQMAAAYVALNPVDAGLCARPEDWAWSSHAAAIGTAALPPWLDVPRLLGYFASAGGEPVRRYERLVRERKEARARLAARASVSSDWDDVLQARQFATPAGDCERIHSRSVSSPTRA
jgi:REP element-mobilizing transposase RayT